MLSWRSSVLPIILLLLSCPILVVAQDGPASGRPFAPVQGGHVDAAPAQLPYAPDRVMVRLTPKAAGSVQAVVGDKRGDATVTTGLAGLDALLREVGARRLVRPYDLTARKNAKAAYGLDRVFACELDGPADVPSVAARLQASPDVEIAEPDWRAFPATVPDDPYYPDHWGHDNTGQLPSYDWGGTWNHTGPPIGTPGFDANADVAWGGSQGFGDPGTIIAIIDSGVDTGHPDLRLVAGYDFGDNDNDPMDNSADPGHGTACAGVAAAIADNGIGVAGAAGGCSIMPLKVADSQGYMYFSYIQNALHYAADNGADVASMSFGAAISSDPLTDASLQYAYDNGVTLCAATGNENASTISYPAINQYVIGVGAASPCGDRKRSSDRSNEVNPGVETDPNGYTCDGERWWGSNYGVDIPDAAGAVDVLGPTILPTTDISGGGGYQSGDYEPFFNGTSCATPYVAGVCALIKSLHPTWTPAQVRSKLVASTTDVVNVESGAGWDRYSGYGLVDAAAAVDMAGAQPPVASFTATPVSGCAPLVVTFTDASSGNITSWSWDFGDGSPADPNQNPTHTYTAPGIYTVTLTVTGPDGSDTLTQADLVTVDGPPTASFGALPTSGQVPLTVAFVDSSLGATGWLWDFGDGAPGTTSQNPFHTYSQAGTYTVTLIVTAPCGADTLTLVDMITVTAPPPPVSAFGADPTSGCAPLTVSFSDSSTGDITEWSWDFGDGSPADPNQNPTHTYTQPGVYTVSLTVTGPGGSDTATLTDLITVDGPPTAAFAATPVSGQVPLTVAFTDSSTGATGWQWDFGDGSPVDTTQNPTHTYDTAGTYTVTLVVTAPCGADTLTLVDLIDVVAPSAPVAAFGAEPTAGCAPLAVAFSDSSTGDVTGWSWDFGDGSPADTTQNPTHTYDAAGTYTVTLTVTGPGGSDSVTRTDLVTVAGPPTALFFAAPTAGPSPLAVSFSDSSAGATGWQWDFGDGSPADTTQHPTHTYTAAGTYDVTLIVFGACGSDTLVRTACVTVSATTGVGDGVPRPFALEPNYPNPFNPSTTLAFSLPADGPVTLEVFDATGRRVATLVEGELPAGRHAVTWRPVDRASGVYFARLRAGGKTAVTRLVLLK